MVNRHVASTSTSPISEAYSWLASVERPDDQELIDVAQAVPGYPPPDGLIDHLRSVDPVPLTRYGPVLGQPSLREALAEDVSKAYAASVSDQQVAITAGANQAFCLAVMALCEAGDEVIIPTPYYFNHDMWLRINGVHPIHLTCDDQMLPDPAEAAALITERTKAIAMVSPNNPTGRVYPQEIISGFARAAAANGIHLILDETYRDFRPSTEPAHDLFTDPCWDDTLVHLHSFSKVFSITGYRVGGMVADPALLTEVEKIADCVTICPSRLGQEAAEYGLAHLSDWVEGNRTMMNRRVGQFVDLVDASSSGFSVASAGAYFAYVRHPFEGVAGMEIARRLLAEQSVLALAGEMFGSDQHPYLRLAFANLDDDRIPVLVQRLESLGE